MNLERYEYKSSPDHKEYIFFSEGPKGRIKKIVRLQQIARAANMFNLVFGDAVEDGDVVDDRIISNNRDADKILATVASIVLEFTEYFPGAYIHAKGRTPSRTRLYQMAINRKFPSIALMFDILGFTERHELEPFAKGTNYLCLVVQRKKL